MQSELFYDSIRNFNTDGTDFKRKEKVLSQTEIETFQQQRKPQSGDFLIMIIINYFCFTKSEQKIIAISTTKQPSTSKILEIIYM